MKVGDVVEVNVLWEPPRRVGKIVGVCGAVHRLGKTYSPGYLVIFSPTQVHATATKFRLDELRHADAVTRLSWLVKG